MKKSGWQVLLGLALLLFSSMIYYAHYLLFHDAHHIFLYLVGDIAFIPVEVLLVTLIIHRMLNDREKKLMLKKLNMIIGSFFSEVGTELLALFSSCDRNSRAIIDKLLVKGTWTKKDFFEASCHLRDYQCNIVSEPEDLVSLKQFLLKRRSFLLSLLNNPNLLEHEAFTDLLWAVFHLTEELAHRKNPEASEGKDREHLALDIKRAYGLLITQWIEYMKHLKRDYPYLFSFAMRTNPFDQKITVEIKEA
jgi:hypothetical protein